MSWRDFIVTSHPPQPASKSPAKSNFVDFVDIVLNKEKKSLSSYREHNPQILNPQNPSTKSTKLPAPVPGTPTGQTAPILADTSADKIEEVATDRLIPPVQAGWLVSYRDLHGAMCGGCDDREHGTVRDCRWDGNGWTVHLTDGQRLTLSAVRAVGQTDEAGHLLEAYTVREHGYDGKGPLKNRG